MIFERFAAEEALILARANLPSGQSGAQLGRGRWQP